MPTGARRAYNEHAHTRDSRRLRRRRRRQRRRGLGGSHPAAMLLPPPSPQPPAPLRRPRIRHGHEPYNRLPSLRPPRPPTPRWPMAAHARRRPAPRRRQVSARRRLAPPPGRAQAQKGRAPAGGGRLAATGRDAEGPGEGGGADPVGDEPPYNALRAGTGIQEGRGDNHTRNSLKVMLCYRENETPLKSEFLRILAKAATAYTILKKKQKNHKNGKKNPRGTELTAPSPFLLSHGVSAFPRSSTWLTVPRSEVSVCSSGDAAFLNRCGNSGF